MLDLKFLNQVQVFTLEVLFCVVLFLVQDIVIRMQFENGCTKTLRSLPASNTFP